MSSSIPNSSAERDRQVALHPFVDPLGQVEPFVVSAGKGIRITDEQGKVYIDAMAGLWCASLGFSNERVARAAYEQMLRLPYYHAFTGKTHLPLIELSEKLLDMAPVPMSKVFLANSGSEANDTAIKLIWYYNNALGRPAKKKIIGRVRGYHGITLATASVTGQVINHRGFDVPLPGFVHVQAPDTYHNARPGESEEDYATRCAEELDALIVAEGPDTVAAMFMEPVVGGGGVLVPPATYYEKIQAVLRRHDVLIVADEVICGFGRTGKPWGCQAVGIEPDILSCAKALSASFLPISALLINQKVFDGLARQIHEIGTFGHGFTYSGHPTAAAAALEVLKIYEEDRVFDHAASVGAFLQSELRRRLSSHPLVGDVRGIGLLGGVELVADKALRQNFPPTRKVGAAMVRLCESLGLIVRACPNDTIALSPPLIITREEVSEVIDTMARALDLLAAEVAQDNAA